MDLKECIEKKFVKKINIDLDLIQSLKESSKNKSISAGLLEITEVTAPSIITLYYGALRELLEALAIFKEFKIYNHLCYTSFLKEILKEEELAVNFDRLRKIRNSLNYYGESISIEDANFIISDIQELIETCQLLLQKEVENV